ncbi:PREDICTED: ribosome biogenesis protein BRX1 homolog [Acropora digitifera]|uniref:ribosome biogenesis protein BRX1 homolog n=1 Tax=Acropora digitifera TaxID=70779 RepID=UPI00077ACCD0|nr:PREDICTED: ribosome biogenesis protein BRX1 homolog [Acropora digitifera]
MAKKRKVQDTDSITDTNAVQTKKTKVKKGKWTNKQRVMVFCARGITHRARHLMLDIRTLLPHSKSGMSVIIKLVGCRLAWLLLNFRSPLCDLKNCNKSIFFEMRKGKDLYMCCFSTPVQKHVVFMSVHTMDELKLTGNALLGSRPILSFDKCFDETPPYSLLKEMFIQIFSTPCYHPKSKPFVDHILSFSVDDNRIWFRNFQIVEEDGSLLEIGPRFVLNLIRVFDGSFGGATLFQNPRYQSPNQVTVYDSDDLPSMYNTWFSVR